MHRAAALPYVVHARARLETSGRSIPCRPSSGQQHGSPTRIPLMRTTADEAGDGSSSRKLNSMESPGASHSRRRVSCADETGKPFGIGGDKALFTAIESNFRRGPRRILIRSPLHLNDPAFADLLVEQFQEVCAESAAVTRIAVH